MVSKIAIVGLAILVVGIIVGFVGAYVPSSATSSTSSTLLNTTFAVDANDYQSKNLNLTSGEQMNVQVSILNNTIFQVEILNASQYGAGSSSGLYGCLPFCRAAPNGSVVGYVPEQNITALKNVTVTSSSPQSFSFVAPSSGTFYLVLDNSVGPSYTTYLDQNASLVACNTPNPFHCLTVGNLTITYYPTISSINWVFVAPGIALLLVGGAIATAAWDSGSRAAREPSPTSTTTGPK